MKKLISVILGSLFLFTAGMAMAQDPIQEWHVMTTPTMAWDPVTQNVDGTDIVLQNGQLIQYRAYVLDFEAPTGTPLLVSSAPFPETQFTYAIDVGSGKWVLCADTVVTNADGSIAGTSNGTSCSNIAEYCQNGVTFAINQSPPVPDMPGSLRAIIQ